jgi:hypothetical protein
MCFMGCSSLSSIIFESSSKLSCMEVYAFRDCVSLSSLSIPSSVERLCRWCFVKCSSLAEVTFETGSRLSCIEADVFQHCSSRLSISIPLSLQSIFARYQPPLNFRVIVPDVRAADGHQRGTGPQRGPLTRHPIHIQIPCPAGTQLGQRGRPNPGRRT